MKIDQVEAEIEQILSRKSYMMLISVKESLPIPFIDVSVRHEFYWEEMKGFVDNTGMWFIYYKEYPVRQLAGITHWKKIEE